MEEAARQQKIFRDSFRTEEAGRISAQIRELKEALLEFRTKVNLEGYIRYFYEIKAADGLHFFPPQLHTVRILLREVKNVHNAAPDRKLPGTFHLGHLLISHVHQAAGKRLLLHQAPRQGDL